MPQNRCIYKITFEKCINGGCLRIVVCLVYCRKTLDFFSDSVYNSFAG